MNNSLVFPVNICRTSVRKRPDPDTLALSVSKSLNTSAPVPMSGTKVSWVQTVLGQKCSPNSPNSPTPACLHRQYWHE